MRTTTNEEQTKGSTAHWELSAPCPPPHTHLLPPGALLLLLLQVADPAATDKATLALREFNRRVVADARVSLSIVPIGDGMALCRVREV